MYDLDVYTPTSLINDDILQKAYNMGYAEGFIEKFVQHCYKKQYEDCTDQEQELARLCFIDEYVDAGHSVQDALDALKIKDPDEREKLEKLSKKKEVFQ